MQSLPWVIALILAQFVPLVAAPVRAAEGGERVLVLNLGGGGRDGEALAVKAASFSEQLRANVPDLEVLSYGPEGRQKDFIATLKDQSEVAGLVVFLSDLEPSSSNLKLASAIRANLQADAPIYVVTRESTEQQDPAKFDTLQRLIRAELHAKGPIEFLSSNLSSSRTGSVMRRIHRFSRGVSEWLSGKVLATTAAGGVVGALGVVAISGALGHVNGVSDVAGNAMAGAAIGGAGGAGLWLAPALLSHKTQEIVEGLLARGILAEVSIRTFNFRNRAQVEDRHRLGERLREHMGVAK